MRIPLENGRIAIGEKLINYEVVDTNAMGLYLYVCTDAKEDKEYIALNDYLVNKYFQLNLPLLKDSSIFIEKKLP